MGVETALYVAAAATVAGTVANVQATNAQNDAQKRAAALERARARIENQRQARLAVAEDRKQRAAILASTQSQNAGANSSVSGAIGSLRSNTASSIGAANTNLAALQGQSLTLQKGASKAARLSNIASGFEAIGSVSTGVGTYLQGGGTFGFNKKKSSGTTRTS